MIQTQNYNLPQFTSTDKFTKEDFNDAFNKVDTGMSDLQETINNASGNAGVTAQEVVLARKGETSLKVKIDKIDENVSSINTQLEENMKKTNYFVNVKSFRCEDGQYVQGDGIHDDTTGIQKALDYCDAYQGGTKLLVWDEGTYVTTDTIYFGRGKHQANNVTILFKSYNSSKTCVKFRNKTGTDITYEVFLVGIRLKNDETGILTNTGFDLGQTSQVYLTDCQSNGFNIGFNLYDSDIGSIIRPTVAYCNTAFLLYETVAYNILHGNFWRNKIVFKLKVNSQGNFIKENWFEDNIVDFDLTDTLSGRINTQFFISNNMFLKGSTTDFTETTYVLKAISSNSGISAKIFFMNNLFRFNNYGNHNLVYFDGASLSNCILEIDWSKNIMYYHTSPTGKYIFSAFNNQVQEIIVRYEDNFNMTSALQVYNSNNIRKNGIDSTNHYSQANAMFLLADNPASLKNKGLFYNTYTKQISFLDENGTERAIITSTNPQVFDSTATDVATLKNDFNNLLAKLRDTKIIKS